MMPSLHHRVTKFVVRSSVVDIRSARELADQRDTNHIAVAEAMNTVPAGARIQYAS
tara:strand:+ start:191 stop:358 length:168 start_codon:yes stop_codon:yes gene_type:complete